MSLQKFLCDELCSNETLSLQPERNLNSGPIIFNFLFSAAAPLTGCVKSQFLPTECNLNG
jgi:hypothetical protein